MFLNRFVVDVVTEEELPEHRQAKIASEMSEWAHLLGTEPDDEMVNVMDKFANGHTHDTTQDVCGVCRFLSRDSKNGDTVE